MWLSPMIRMDRPASNEEAIEKPLVSVRGLIGRNRQRHRPGHVFKHVTQVETAIQLAIVLGIVDTHLTTDEEITAQTVFGSAGEVVAETSFARSLETSREITANALCHIRIGFELR